MTLRELLHKKKKISFYITNDMGEEVLIDSENLPKKSIKKIRNKIESWFREATKMPDQLRLELYLSNNQAEWDATAVDNHNFDSNSDFTEDILDCLIDSDEPAEKFSINFSAEGVFSKSETCEVNDLYFCHFTEEDEEVEIELSDKQIKLLQNMIIKFVQDNPSESLDLAADYSYSLSVEDDTISFINEGCPEICQNLFEFIDLDAEI